MLLDLRRVRVLQRIELDVRERRKLEHRRKLIQDRIQLLQTALNGPDGRGISLSAETVMAQRMYLSMMKTKLQRIESELRQ
jgi:hypothetical protein